MSTALLPARPAPAPAQGGADAGPRVREATPADLPALHEFMRGLSPTARARRFFVPLRELPSFMTDAIARRDPAHHFVVADLGSELLALGQYAVDAAAQQCEMALVVADAWQSRGLGRQLVDRLVLQAAGAGLRRAVVETSRSNAPMQRLARACGFALACHPTDPTLLLGLRAL